MDAKMNQRLSHLFWLEQWREIRDQAREIIKHKKCHRQVPKYFQVVILAELEEFELGLKTKDELEDSIINHISSYTKPRLNPGEKYLDQELF